MLYFIRRGPRKWEDSGRGSALMCAQVIKLRLTNVVRHVNAARSASHVFAQLKSRRK